MYIYVGGHGGVNIRKLGDHNDQVFIIVCRFYTNVRKETAKHQYRPLSRRLDRCDRVIHNESGDPNGGNNIMCSFSGATCTSRVRHNADYVPFTRKPALIYRRGLRQRVASLTLNCNGVSAIRAYGPNITQHNHRDLCRYNAYVSFICMLHIIFKLGNYLIVN